MIQLFARGLEVEHPAAYCLIFILIGIPLLATILLGMELLIDKLKKRKDS